MGVESVYHEGSMKRGRKPSKSPVVLCEMHSEIVDCGPRNIGYDPCPCCGKMRQSRPETKEEVQLRIQTSQSKKAAELREAIKRRLGDQTGYTIQIFPYQKITSRCYRMVAKAIKDA